MKKQMTTWIIPSILTIVALVVIGSACGPPTPTPSACVTTGTDFQNLFTSTLASNAAFSNDVTMDLLTHEYTFTVNTSKTICQVGYQGNATMFANSLPYTIEIYNNTSSVMVFSGSFLFSSASTDYKPAIGTLNPGNSYTIRRVIPATGYLGSLNNVIGRICRFNSASVPYPVTSGAITITGSNFYGSGGPVPNFGIPYIDIVFQ